MKEKKRTTGAFLLCVLALGATGCSTVSSDTIRFGAAGLGGTYRTFGDTLTDLVKTEDESLEIEVKTTAGSAANLRLLSEGYIQMAVAQMDLIYDSFHGEGVFADGNLYQGSRAIASLYTEACQIVVRGDSGIDSVEELQGKKVSIGEEESGTEQNAAQILAACGLSETLVEEVNLNYTDAAAQLESGEIDAMFVTAGTATTVIEELAEQCEIRLIGLDSDAVSRLLESYEFYTEVTIPEGTYHGQTEAVQTVGVKAVLLANEDMSEETVQKVTQILFDHRDELQYSLSVDLSLDETSATEGMIIPFHKGAAAYYAEKGIEVNTEITEE